MNELLGLAELVLVFAGVVLSKKFFGRHGLIAWVAIAGVLANIQVAKSITIFGLDATLGNVMFASSFLATDILSECYGKKYAKKAVIMGICAILLFVGITQLSLVFIPSEFDVMNATMTEFFQISARTMGASVLMYGIANAVDVVIFDKLKKATHGKYMWLRNNISTILCNGLENYGFIFLAFYGVLETEALLPIALTTTVIEIAIALLDTPFLYIAKRIKAKDEAND